MENNSLLSLTPTPILSHFLSIVSSASLLLPAVAATCGWLSGRSSELGAESGAYVLQSTCVALQCWGGSDCGSQSYVGNVSLCSTRAGPEKPTTLFKEMAVRGPSANSLLLHFSVCLTLLKAPLPSLYKNENYFPL